MEKLFPVDILMCKHQLPELLSEFLFTPKTHANSHCERHGRSAALVASNRLPVARRTIARNLQFCSRHFAVQLRIAAGGFEW